MTSSLSVESSPEMLSLCDSETLACGEGSGEYSEACLVIEVSGHCGFPGVPLGAED